MKSTYVYDVEELIGLLKNIGDDSSLTLGNVEFSEDFIEDLNRIKKNNDRYEWLRDYHFGNATPDCINLMSSSDSIEEAIDENMTSSENVQ